jgi:hypothetical protein
VLNTSGSRLLYISTIDNLDQFEATQYILLITGLPTITVKATVEEKKVIFYINGQLKTQHITHFIRLNQVYSTAN